MVGTTGPLQAAAPVATAVEAMEAGTESLNKTLFYLSPWLEALEVRRIHRVPWVVMLEQPWDE